MMPNFPLKTLLSLFTSFLYQPNSFNIFSPATTKLLQEEEEENSSFISLPQEMTPQRDFERFENTVHVFNCTELVWSYDTKEVDKTSYQLRLRRYKDLL
jgi:hypothetical protein